MIDQTDLISEAEKKEILTQSDAFKRHNTLIEVMNTVLIEISVQQELLYSGVPALARGAKKQKETFESLYKNLYLMKKSLEECSPELRKSQLMTHRQYQIRHNMIMGSDYDIAMLYHGRQVAF